jgi:hypothetical protein
MFPLVAAKYNTRLIALTMRSEGIPVSAEERVNIALEAAHPALRKKWACRSKT